MTLQNYELKTAAIKEQFEEIKKNHPEKLKQALNLFWSNWGFADLFVQHKVKAAIEPIRSAEVSLIHTIADAKRYIDAVNHPGVQHINGDLYHMQSEESHIGEALLNAGEKLTNLHMADSNRCALGDGAMDIDSIIMALYVAGYNRPGCYCTPEPLGPGGDPYPAMHGKTNPKLLDDLVNISAVYFKQRETTLLDA